jgi:hypothetical protein
MKKASFLSFHPNPRVYCRKSLYSRLREQLQSRLSQVNAAVLLRSLTIATPQLQLFAISAPANHYWLRG